MPSSPRCSAIPATTNSAPAIKETYMEAKETCIKETYMEAKETC